MKKIAAVLAIMVSASMSIYLTNRSCATDSDIVIQDNGSPTVWLHTSTNVTNCLLPDSDGLVCVEVGGEVYAVRDERDIPVGDVVDIVIGMEKIGNNIGVYKVSDLEILD